jgi:hypothetical protein
VHQFGTRLEHRAHSIEVAATHRVRQPLGRHAFHTGLELWPTIKAVRAREDKLRVVKRERRGLRGPMVCENFGDRAGLARDKCV